MRLCKALDLLERLPYHGDGCLRDSWRIRFVDGISDGTRKKLLKLSKGFGELYEERKRLGLV